MTVIMFLFFFNVYVTLDHKTSLRLIGNICSKLLIIIFSLMPKIIKILSKGNVHEDILYISYRTYFIGTYIKT